MNGSLLPKLGRSRATRMRTKIVVNQLGARRRMIQEIA